MKLFKVLSLLFIIFLSSSSQASNVVDAWASCSSWASNYASLSPNFPPIYCDASGYLSGGNIIEAWSEGCGRTFHATCNTFAVTSGCPVDTVFSASSGQCESTTPCTEGFEDHGGVCGTNPRCPTGYNFEIVTPDNPSGCVNAFIENDCAIGTHLDGVSCLPDSCLSGNYLNPQNDQCEPIAWSCRFGTIPDENGGAFCVSETETPPDDPSCPLALVYDGFNCVPDLTLPPSCPDGFSFDGTHCISVPTAPNPSDGSCLEGSFLNIDNLCEIEPIFSDPTIQCSDGLILYGSQCIPVVECPSGTSFKNGVCESNLTCPQGQVFISGICSNPSDVCTNGSIWNGSSCSPTVTSSELQCQDGSVLQGSLCVAPFNACSVGSTLSGSSCVNDIDPNISEPATCPSGSTKSGTSCVTDEYTTCPPEYTKIGDKCELVSKFTDFSCTVEPSCSGDAILCAIARQGWATACARAVLSPQQVKDALGFLTLSDDIEVNVGELDTSGFGLSTECPAPRTIQVMSAPFTIDMSPFCSLADIIGHLILITASFVSIRIIASS
jgi:hypothetical protein